MGRSKATKAPSAVAERGPRGVVLGQNDSVATPKKSELQGWRSRLKVHPVADMFPLMSTDELRELADDIAKNGLQEKPVFVWRADTGDLLLDGRNRLDALELLGRKITKASLRILDPTCKSVDPVSYVISRNIRRRHLTSAQKEELIAALLKIDPEKSNREIGRQLHVDHEKVGAVREQKVRTGEIPPVQKTKGKDGKKRPALRSKAKSKPAGTSVVRLNGGAATSAPPKSPDSAIKQSAHYLREFITAAREYLPKVTAAADREQARLIVARLTGRVGNGVDPDQSAEEMKAMHTQRENVVS